MLPVFRRLLKDDDGTTLMQYVVIASLISIAVIVAMGSRYVANALP
jgi:Flp pilus assembly pilin Flp